MIELQPVPATMIDRAWHDGASCLSEACDKSGGEIEGPQLKMILSRGERTLLRMWDGDVLGWVCIAAGTPGTWLQARSLTGN
jgi:hypothetical protein